MARGMKTGGTRPMPTAIKHLHGIRDSRINDDEPPALPDPPVLPEWAADDQRAVWDRVTEQLQAMKVLYKADQDVLWEYVVSVSIAQRCEKIINDSGLLIRDASGQPRANPVFTMWDKAATRLTTLAREFGMTPSARAALKRSETKPTAQTADDAKPTPASYFTA